MSLVRETIDAHGGLSRWGEVSRIALRVRCGGIAMAMKGRPGVLRELDAVVETARPRVTFDQLGEFDSAQGRPAGISRRLRWTDSDVRHFAGYALWNYMNTPFIFDRPDVVVEELRGRRLRVTFPPSVPTHSSPQTFRIRDDGLIASLDYTAEVFGPWAKGRNHCLEYEEVDGLVFVTRRRVVPRGLPGPVIVSVAIDRIRLG